MNKLKSKYLIVLVCIVALVAVIAFLNTSKSEPKNIDSHEKLRIVSLIPSLTQSIYYLEANDLLVGRTSYCQVPPGDSIEIVSSTIKPNVEKIVTLRPDIILVSGLISAKDIETFQKFGIQVEKFISPKSFEEICSQLERLGKLVGKEQKAKEIVEDSKAKVEAIQKTTNKGSKPKIFMQIGASPIFAVIPNTFMDDYIQFCGATNIMGELTSGTVSREYVVSQDPDIIFVVTMGIVAESEIDEWRKFSQMKAVANNKIFVLNSDIACQPTPITFVQTLELIKNDIE